MTGPKHYREAEKLIDDTLTEGLTLEQEALILRHAQVHATLALAAAQAHAAIGPDAELADAWCAVMLE